MKRAVKSILSIILVTAFILSVTSAFGYASTAAPLPVNTAASADENMSRFSRLMYSVADYFVNELVGVIGKLYPQRSWLKDEDYESRNFLSGMDTFLSEPAEGAVWSLGYASESIQTGQETDGKHYIGGTLSVKPKTVNKVVGDQRVRTFAINDGSGRGTLVFSVIDAYGISNTEVRKIREMLEDYAKINNIVSINISVLHQHSCVDTFGMNGDILKAFFGNALINLFKIDKQFFNGINDSFMDNLFKMTVKSVKDAVKSMRPGRLYYSAVDAEKYIRDKRNPITFDKNLNRFRFVPNDGSRETWIVNAAIHCVANGVDNDVVTADYPYYMEREINDKADANFALIQGAELAITTRKDEVVTETSTALEEIEGYGRILADLLINIDDRTEKEIEPLLNVKHREFRVPVLNNILVFAANAGILTNSAVKKSDGSVEIVTELGYIEIGKEFSFAVIPGELSPELAYGGILTASESWNGKDFGYPSLQEIAGNDRKLLVLGIANDQIGYILPDNDYRSIFLENEEIVSPGKKTGSAVVSAFKALIEEIRYN
ncbi:MAG: hypothetical protein K5756_08805 [Clostridiales bacterium]|nr:hypothetical protein [Clostridiales bacterium]